MKRIFLLYGPQCDICGSTLMLFTDAEQPDDTGWCAHDGDEVLCEEGLAAYCVNADDAGAEVALIEEHPRTVVAVERQNYKSDPA
mgnify:CR=1 FL=1